MLSESFAKLIIGKPAEVVFRDGFRIVGLLAGLSSVSDYVEIRGKLEEKRYTTLLLAHKWEHGQDSGYAFLHVRLVEIGKTSFNSGLISFTY